MNMITESGSLLKAAATQAGERLTTAGEQLERKLRSTGTALAEATQPVFDTTRKTAAFADGYVHGHPWTVLGVGVGVGIAAGVVIGFLAAKR